MKKTTVFAIAMSVAMAAGWGQAHARDKLRLGTEGAYPPFNFIEPNGTAGGFDVEIGLALCEKMDADCEVVTQDWDGIIPGLQAKKYDFIIASMSITDERKQQVAFTDPYYKSALALVAPKDSDIVDVSPEALAGKVIGSQAGTTQGNYAQTFTKSDVKLYPTQEEVNLDLLNGRLDYIVADALALADFLKGKGKDCCRKIAEVKRDDAIHGPGVAGAVRKSDTALKEMISKAIAETMADGSHKKLEDKWFIYD